MSGSGKCKKYYKIIVEDDGKILPFYMSIRKPKGPRDFLPTWIPYPQNVEEAEQQTEVLMQGIAALYVGAEAKKIRVKRGETTIIESCENLEDFQGKELG